MNDKAAKESLLEVKEVLNELKIKFWLTWGTLLGAVRDKGFIPWDTHIDLKMLAKDWNPSLSENFRVEGFRSEGWAKYQNKLPAVNLIKRDVKIELALEYYYSPGDFYLTCIPSPCYIRTVTPAKFYQGDYFIDFLGKQFRVPNPPEEYLDRVFGKNWKTPIKKGWRPPFKGIPLNEYHKWLSHI